MEIIEGPLQVEQLQEQPSNQSQPQAKPSFFEDTTVSPLSKEPLLDDSAVRAATIAAEAKGLDPEKLTMGDFLQGPTQEIPAAPKAESPEVPAKFLKPDGEVDVEKLKTSTQQLGEAIKNKEEAVQKTVDDYVRDYKEMEAKFHSLPNPQKVAQELPKHVPQEIAPTMTEEQLQQRLRQDLEKDPVGVMTGLVDVIVQQRMSPFAKEIESVREEKKQNALRDNIAAIAKADPRIMRGDVFEAVKQKLREQPELWNLKNPHKAAFLEVKEELRLGDLTSQPAQPSRPLSPVLGGGVPPSAPSSQSTRVSSIDQLDLRNKKHEAAGDEFIKAMLARER